MYKYFLSKQIQLHYISFIASYWLACFDKCTNLIQVKRLLCPLSRATSSSPPPPSPIAFASSPPPITSPTPITSPPSPITFPPSPNT